MTAATPPSVELQEQRAELKSVLESGAFVRAPKLAAAGGRGSFATYFTAHLAVESVKRASAWPVTVRSDSFGSKPGQFAGVSGLVAIAPPAQPAPPQMQPQQPNAAAPWPMPAAKHEVAPE